MRTTTSPGPGASNSSSSIEIGVLAAYGLRRTDRVEDGGARFHARSVAISLRVRQRGFIREDALRDELVLHVGQRFFVDLQVAAEIVAIRRLDEFRRLIDVFRHRREVLGFEVARARNVGRAAAQRFHHGRCRRSLSLSSEGPKKMPVPAMPGGAWPQICASFFSANSAVNGAAQNIASTALRSSATC